MIYFIDTVKRSFNEKGKYSAMSKPRTDIIKSFLSFPNTRLVTITSRVKENPSRMARMVNNVWMLIESKFKCSKIRRTDVVVQYPFTDGIMIPIIKSLIERGNRIHIVIHDIETIRQNRTIERDKFILKIADTLIVHTPEMKSAIKGMGYEGRIEILEFFDYLMAGNTPSHRIGNDNRVIFAGNLKKSQFIPKLEDIIVDKNFSIFLYGKPETSDIKEFVKYKGFFQADDISGIEGDWGLVWDGDSVDTCSGEFGDYLKYNAQFKMSLYLAAGMPVIVWKQSAMAQYVNNYHLGLCVDSLHDIRSCILKLSEKERKEIERGVQTYSEKVRTGQMFKKIMNKLFPEELCVKNITN